MTKHMTKLERSLGNFLRRCKNKRHESGELLYVENSEIFFGDKASDILKKFDEWMEPIRNKINVGISGSWQNLYPNVVDDVAFITRYFVNRDIGIVNGLALGVDFVSNEVILKEGDPRRAEKLLRGISPIALNAFMQRFNDRYEESFITKEQTIHCTQAKSITNQLQYLKKHFHENIFDQTIFNEREFLIPENEHYRQLTYTFRNGLIGYAVDGLVALCVNDSEGVQDALRKLKKMGKPSLTLVYNIDKSSKKIIDDYTELRIPNIPDKYPLPMKWNSPQYLTREQIVASPPSEFSIDTQVNQ